MFMKQQCHKKVLSLLLFLLLDGINAGKLVIDYDENQKAVEQYIDLVLYSREPIEKSYLNKILQKITTFNVLIDFTCNGQLISFHPMALALLCHRQDVVDVILDGTVRAPFNPNYIDNNGNSFLHFFLGFKLSKYLTPFLDFKELQFDRSNRKKVTPLMIAVMQKNYWWINTLLHEGANKYAMDGSGKSVKQYMQESFDNQKDVDFYFPRSGRSISVVSPEDFLKQEKKQVKNNFKQLRDEYNERQMIMETRV